MDKNSYISKDIIYMRYVKQNKVLRVARIDPVKGLVLALYPSDDKDFFYTEAFHDIEDTSTKEKINRKQIRDEIWIRLLDGEKSEKILENYVSTINTDKPRIDFSYFFYKKNSSNIDSFSINRSEIRTFHILKDRDEEVMLEEMKNSKFLSS